MNGKRRTRKANPQAAVSSFLKLPLWLKIVVAAVVVVIVVVMYLNRPQVVMPEGELHVTVIDVGNADSILLQTGETAMLIDAGERGDGDDILAVLKEKGVETLDVVIATHADGDHIGGMQTVLEGVTVEQYIMAFMPNGYTPTTKTYQNVMNTLDEKNISIKEAQVGEQFSLGEATVEILGPVQDFEDNNNQSVICKVTFGEKKFLFMGDAETEAEEALLATSADLSADFLKVGHHGSSTSTTKALLERVQPRLAVITSGAGNAYGHPHKELLTRLKNEKVSYYRSDVNGTVTLRCDGKDITVTSEKGGVAA